MAKRGGARPGAGRKKGPEKFPGAAALADQTIAEKLPKLLENLFVLADGGFEQVEEKWEEGELPADSKPGDKPPLVLVSRKVTWAAPDRAANQYLIDRILGRPTERHEVTGEDGAPFKVYLGIDVDQV